MNRAALDRIADAVLYEGYLLYPYRGSAAKNRQRWTFGGLHPLAGAQTEVLVRGPADARVEVSARFLQLCERRNEADATPPWHEAIDREIAAPDATLEALACTPLVHEFACEGDEWYGEGIVRRRTELAGRLELWATRVEAEGVDAWRLHARVDNVTRSADAGELALMASMHLLLGVAGGAFESSFDPDARLAGAAAACINQGVWPVLAGTPGERDTMIASPIILYDYPVVAEESPGDLFDGTEIDEILSLRILTLTDAEKHEVRATDERARQLLERTEALGAADLKRLHASMRRRPVAALRPGTRVRLRPQGRRDILDLALAGRTGEIASVEEDFEGRVLLTVLVDDDPGKDLGREGKPGHRFFFHPEEVEIL